MGNKYYKNVVAEKRNTCIHCNGHNIPKTNYFETTKKIVSYSKST